MAAVDGKLTRIGIFYDGNFFLEGRGSSSSAMLLLRADCIPDCRG